MRRLTFSILLPVLALLAGAAAAQPVSEPASDEPYRLQPGDTVELSVIEDPNLNRTVLVRPDGRITLPIVGPVEAAGRSPEAVARTIEARLAGSFEIMPTVSLALVGLGPDGADDDPPPAAYVLGQVRSPGAISLERPLTLLQALALVGGLDVFAAPARIQLRRQTEDGAETLAFDYEAFESGEDPGIADLPLQDGDVVVVPERTPFE